MVSGEDLLTYLWRVNCLLYSLLSHRAGLPVIDERGPMKVKRPFQSNIYLLTYLVISQAMKNENEETL